MTSMKKGEGLLTLAPAQKPLRRKSATELSTQQQLPQDAFLKQPRGSLGRVSDLPIGSRSAATSPISGGSSNLGSGLGDATLTGSSLKVNSTNSSPRHCRTSNEAWVCPNDRQLALRAKLHSGWSAKTAKLNQWKQPEPMTSEEHEMILKVIEKAEALERAEQERVGRLVERLEAMRRCRLGNGETECILCGETFRFYHRSQRRCAECAKMTCSKCGQESAVSHHPHGGTNLDKGQSQLHRRSSTLSSSPSVTSMISALSGAGVNHLDSKETVWLCKICGEEREMWKKSGAWFFKSMPKYVLPENENHRYLHQSRLSKARYTRRFSHYTPLVSRSIENLGAGYLSGRDDDNSSEEEGQLASRLFRAGSKGRQSISSAGPCIGFSNSSSPMMRSTSEVSGDDHSIVSAPAANDRGDDVGDESDISVRTSVSVIPEQQQRNSRSRVTYPHITDYSEGQRSSSVPNSNRSSTGVILPTNGSVLPPPYYYVMGPRGLPMPSAIRIQGPRFVRPHPPIPQQQTTCFNYASRVPGTPPQVRLISGPGGQWHSAHMPQGHLPGAGPRFPPQGSRPPPGFRPPFGELASPPFSPRMGQVLVRRCGPPPPGYIHRGPPRHRGPRAAFVKPPWTGGSGQLSGPTSPATSDLAGPTVTLQDDGGCSVIMEYPLQKANFDGSQSPPNSSPPVVMANHGDVPHPSALCPAPGTNSPAKYSSSIASSGQLRQPRTTALEQEGDGGGEKPHLENPVNRGGLTGKVARGNICYQVGEGNIREGQRRQVIEASLSSPSYPDKGPTLIEDGGGNRNGEDVSSKSGDTELPLDWQHLGSSTGKAREAEGDAASDRDSYDFQQKPLSKAKPLNENRFTSTLRRLSSVRKKNRNKKTTSAKPQTQGQRDNIVLSPINASLGPSPQISSNPISPSHTPSTHPLEGSGPGSGDSGSGSGGSFFTTTGISPGSSSAVNDGRSNINLHQNSSVLKGSNGGGGTPSFVVDDLSSGSKQTCAVDSSDLLTSSSNVRRDSHSRGPDDMLGSPKSPDGSYGLIEFSMVYDESESHLVVNVIKAKKLRGTDANGLADSYCRISLRPSLPNKGCSQQCTKVVLKSINPHYNATMHFTGVTFDILLTTEIHAAIMDEDMSGDNLIAEAKFALKSMLPMAQKKFQILLERPSSPKANNGIAPTPSPVGKIEISLAYYSKQGTFKVGILNCYGLPLVNENGPNPLVKVVLIQGNKHQKNQTTVKWRCRDPDFHEQFVYSVSATDLQKQSMNITVWNKEKGLPDEYLAGTVVGMNAKGARLQHWLDVIKNPGQTHTRVHILSANFID